MGDNPDIRRVVSLHLSRTLDEIGLNTVTVKKRRHARLGLEQIDNVHDRLTGQNFTNYHFGSQTEGATTPEMNSDLDTLMCLHDWNVIEDWVDWKQGLRNLLMLHEDTAPGYCRLQLLRPDVPMAWKHLPAAQCTHDNSGRVLLQNTFIHSIAVNMWQDRSGPAASRDGGADFMDDDFVYALLCKTWPGQAEEFIRRRRRHGWPSQRLLEDAVSHGVFLVPVGNKLSPTEPLEWRISASLAERCLMFSLTIVHIKCYVVLKIIAKKFIRPRIKESISSYHCKTALLHCTETTEPDFWREDNLLQCVTQCLEILRNWVADLFCPQFMISGENLFAGKVTVYNRGMILSILTYLIQHCERALLQVRMDDLGLKLQARLNTEPSCVPIVDSIASVELIGQFEWDMNKSINEFFKMYIIDDDDYKQEISSEISSVYQKVCLMKEMVEHANKHERQVLQTFIPLLSCWLGSLLASFSLSHNRRVPRETIQLMSTAAKYDIASMLKLTSVFYCIGKIDKVETTLQAVETQLRRNDVLVVCGCYEKHTILPQEFCHMIHVLRGKKARARLFAHCVRFSRHEIHCAPPALRHEVNRHIGDDIQHRNPVPDGWMALAAVDCLPYVYYLQYLTYKQLGNPGLQRRSLHSLDTCVREEHDFRHLETAWNLLGQCLEDEQDPNAAMNCYRASLQIRPRNNAANWHVAILLYKLIKNCGLLPGIA